VDAVLGTGLTGPAKGESLDAIRIINEKFPLAKKVAVDIPSGLPSDETNPMGEFVRADYTVTFTAPKRSQCMSPIYEHVGKLIVCPIGSPAEIYETNPKLKVSLTTQDDIRHLFAKRPSNSNKGNFGHVLVVGGSFGKSGAPAMAGVAAYRSGAGLVTVAVPKSTLTAVAEVRPELMTEPLNETETGRLCEADAGYILEL
jgi:ADP-dependent NAD(P)H-hydrate dehydratase / NAD(P)H-hydrate epimerase